MNQPASRDPLHYRLKQALDGPLSDGSAQNADLLRDALHGVLDKIVDIERGLMNESAKSTVARRFRGVIAEKLGVER